MADMKMSALRKDAHREAITMISRSRNNKILTLDKTGRLVVWLPNPDDGSLSSLRGPASAECIAAEPIWTQDLEGLLYAFYLQHRKSIETLCELHVYDLETGKLLFDKGWKIDRQNPEALGSVSSVAIVPAHPHLVFLGHLSGHISAWDRSTFKLVYSKKIATEGVTTLLGPSRFLWCGMESGLIEVMDVTLKDWRLLLRWRAHKGAVLKLFLDTKSIWSASSIRVVSTGEDDTIRFWDGLLGDDWKQHILSHREKQYSTYSTLRVNMFTMNLGAAGPKRLTKGLNVDNHNLLHDFLVSLKDPDVIVFGFQEVIDLSDVGLAAQTVLFASETDMTPKCHKWQLILTAAVREHLGDGFVLLKDAKLVGLYSCIFAKRSLRPRMKDLAVAFVKTGIDAGFEDYGNKGSILVRFSLDDSSICLLNNHLAAGEENAEKRAKDIIKILDARFPPPSASTRRAYNILGDGTSVMDHELVFFAGDLNFRLTLPRKTVLKAVKDAKIDELLPYDELRIEMNYNPSFRLHSFSEQAITFPPTYKYNTGEAIYDTSEKKRVPSWCDRILYRSEDAEAIKPLSYRRYEADISDHRPVSAAFECQIRKIDLIAHERVYRGVLRDWSAVE
ncbi:Endonuclease/exonuclease/phosphatase, partial [Leucosporidium creatinivorum]